MPVQELKQLQYEVDSWNRLLEFMIDENIHLKSRLSELIKYQYDKYLLIDAEEFQSKFIRNDELIGLLRNEAVELDKLLLREMFEDGDLMNEIEIKFKNLRNNISSAETGFSNLKSDFNNYLTENIFANEY